MKTTVSDIKRLIFIAIFICCAFPVLAQYRHKPVDTTRKDFYHLLAEANIKFTYPAGFKVIPPVNNEDFSFDYALELPGRDFEIWLQIKSQKQNWNSYLHTQHDAKTQVANPDSIYLQMARENAITLAGADGDILERRIPHNVLARYNADAGKSYVLSLLDMPATKHYKYALIIALQQNHTGTLVAVCFTNQKDPDFYYNFNRASRSFKFKAPAIN